MILLFLLAVIASMISVVAATILGFACAVLDSKSNIENQWKDDSVTRSIIRVMTVISHGMFVLSIVLFSTYL